MRWILVVLVVALPGLVSALDCVCLECPIEASSDFLWPGDGEEEVPIDAALFVGGEHGYQHELEGPEGTVTLVLADESPRNTRVLRVEGGLTPDSSWTLTLEDGELLGFRTGTATAAAPEIPSGITATLARARATLEPCGPGPSSVELEFAEHGFFSVVAEEPDLSLALAVTGSGSASIVGKPDVLQVGGFSAAGGFSGWSEPLPLDWPAAGCTSEVELGWLLLLFLPLGPLRRSRG